MSHLRTLPIYKCQTCQAKATVEVINNRSSGIGFYCQRHGVKALEEFNQRAQGRHDA